MKIRKIISIVALSLICMGFASCNPVAKITFHVVNEEGKPLSGIPIQMGSVIPSSSGNSYETAEGTTDNKGIITLHHEAFLGSIDYNVINLKGWYITGGRYQFTNTVVGLYLPWNPTVEVVVKPIINPIPMYAKLIGSENEVKIPATNTPIGFDLETGDWVAPYGKGTVSDFIFMIDEKVPFVNYHQPFDVIWTLSFADKGDGIQSLLIPINEGSALRFPRNAPTDGYQPTLVQEIFRNGNQGGNGAVGEDQNYFFRVRTVLDEQGNVKSALYGKIAGPIGCGGNGVITFTYYLNPTPNDRNMEFDPSKNLFQNLDILQQVKAP